MVTRVKKVATKAGVAVKKAAVKAAATVAAAAAVVISVVTVREILTLREKRDRLAKELADLEKYLRSREVAVITALDEGVKPGPDCPALAVDVAERITPKWKDEAFTLCDKLGLNKEIYEAEVRARTPVTTIKRLIINGNGK